MKPSFNRCLTSNKAFAAVVTMAFIFIPLQDLPSQAQPPDSGSGLARLSFLLGDWVGEGAGRPGQGAGVSAFSLDLGGRIMVGKSYVEYPASKDQPACRHDDLMVIYPESKDASEATYWDNEGHLIKYAVKISNDVRSAVFLSEATANAPRFRLAYEMIGSDSLTLEFEIAPPGRPEAFTPYIEASLRRK
jgi:hypothetical protein